MQAVLIGSCDFCDTDSGVRMVVLHVGGGRIMVWCRCEVC